MVESSDILVSGLLPAGGGVTADSTDTLTNKTIDANGTGNSISNIDVEDLANGTDGELITWDAAGAPTTIAVGTATQVLTSNGAGAAPTFQAAATGNLVDDTTPQLGGDLDCNGSQIQWSQGADVASATALAVLTDGNYFDVTGTTTITSINTTGGTGTQIKLHFDGALILTHHATNLILPGGANITTAAGDEAEFIEYGSGTYRCTNYSKADGTAVVSGGGGADSLPHGGYVAGRYYSGFYFYQSGTSAFVADKLMGHTFLVSDDVTITGITVNVITTGTATLARIGIYNMENGIPTSLVLDCGTVSVSTTGAKEAVISQALTAGAYCMAVVLDGTCTMTRSVSHTAAITTYATGQTTATGTAADVVFDATHVFAALPSTYPTVTISATDGSPYITITP